MNIENIYDYAIREFKIYFPHIAECTIGYHPIGRNELLFITSDNEHYVYDIKLRAIRKLRSASEDGLSEDDWRAKFSLGLQLKMMGLGLSQKDLSDRTGITCLSIHNYISGKSMPSVYYAEKIAEALGCSIAELTRFQ